MLTKNYAMSLTLCPSVTCCTVAIIGSHSAVHDHEGRRLDSESELVAMKDTFVQLYDTALCSLARETADYAGRAKVKAVECHGRPVRLAPHKSKSSKGFKSRLSAPRHLHAPTSTAHSPLPPSPASVASQTEVAYPASLHRQAESTLAQPSQLSSHVGELER